MSWDQEREIAWLRETREWIVEHIGRIEDAAELADAEGLPYMGELQKCANILHDASARFGHMGVLGVMSPRRSVWVTRVVERAFVPPVSLLEAAFLVGLAVRFDALGFAMGFLAVGRVAAAGVRAVESREETRRAYLKHKDRVLADRREYEKSVPGPLRAIVWPDESPPDESAPTG